MNDLNLPERCKEFKSQRYAFADSSPRLSSFVELSFELPEDTILNNRVSVGQIKTQTAFLKDPFADLLSVNFEAVGLQARTNIHVPSGKVFSNIILHTFSDLLNMFPREYRQMLKGLGG